MMRRTSLWGVVVMGCLALALAACSDDDKPPTPDQGVPDTGGGQEASVDGTAADMTPDSPPATTYKLTILHTNDIHDHLLGHSPNADYTPADTSDKDGTTGGFARLAAKITSEKTAAGSDPVLVVDAGDWSMGTLFSWLQTTAAPTLMLMQDMGYDAITIGNHEFDWTPDALASILDAATKAGFKVPIVASGLVFDSTDTGDDNLEKFVTAGVIKKKLVKTYSGGLKVGILGLLGDDAAGDAPLMDPLTVVGTNASGTFIPKDFQSAVQKAVDDLRNNDKVDVVVVLSHGEVKKNKSGKYEGEDITLAKKVTGIDVLVTGHSHTEMTKSEVVEDDTKKWKTIIVQAGADGKNLGKVELTSQGGKVTAHTYTLMSLDDTIKGDATIQTKIDGYITALDTVLKTANPNLSFKAPVAETTFDLTHPAFQETLLGNVIADAYRGIYNTLNPLDPADIAFDVGGVIRDEILKGKTGKIWFADLYRATPLGIGPTDKKPGYPLVAFYITGADVKTGMELLNLAEGLLNDNNFFVQVSGIETEYKAGSLPTMAVTSLKVGGKTYDPKACYKLVTNYYVASLLGKVAEATAGVLSVQAMSDKACTTKATDMTKQIVDGDPTTTTTVEEIKTWQALLMMVSKFPDTDGDKIPDFPSTYGATQNRIVKK